MPGYGVLPADEGSGLLSWAEADRRLTVSQHYWCATVCPDGRPHVMPVWAVWLGARLWFSSGLRSRKARNLAADPRCTLTTDDARDPVVVEGTAERITDARRIAAFVDAVNAKYDGGMTVEIQDRRSTAPTSSGRGRCSRSAGTTSPGARPAGGSRPRALGGVSLRTCGTARPAVGIDLCVQNLWGLTRRRALDFGRVTT